MMKRLIVVKGAGDLATGIAHLLFRCGFKIVMTELAEPTVIRRTVSFAEAVFCGCATIENVTAVRYELKDLDLKGRWEHIPILVDPLAESVRVLKPSVLVDATIAKRNIGTRITDASLVIGVGPGFTAGIDVHRVVETARGHDLGRVIAQGSAAPNTGIPGEIGGKTVERILRAPCAGLFQGIREIGDVVQSGETVAYVAGQPLTTSIDGILRGLLHDGLNVVAGMKVGDVDPRQCREHCYTISDKARAIGGGVLEAILCFEHGNEFKSAGESDVCV